MNQPVYHLDEQETLTTCEGNKDLREGMDLTDDRQLAEYYRKVIQRRIQNFGG